MERRLEQTRKHNGEEYKFYYIFPSYKGETGVLGQEIRPYIEVETPENGFGYPNLIVLDRQWHFNSDGKFDGYERVPVVYRRHENRSLLKKITKQILTLEKKLGIEEETRTVFDHWKI